MNSNWQKDLHDRLGSYEKDAPDGLWQGICDKLSDTGGKMPAVKAPSILKRRLPAVAAAACAALILGLSLYSRFGGGAGTPESSEELLSSAAQPQAEAGISAAEPASPIESTGRLVAFAVLPGRTAPVAAVEKNCPQESAQPAEEGALPTENGAPAKAEDSDEKDIQAGEYMDRQSSRNIGGTEHAGRCEAGRLKPSAIPARWSLSAGATGSAWVTSSTLYTGEPIVATGADDSGWEDSPMLAISTFNQGRNVTSQFKHYLPVHVAMKAAYSINSRLSIESGLTWTRLSSQMRDGTPENYLRCVQKLDYAGIPVNIKYTALTYHRFNLYGSAGFLAEKCVSGKVIREYIIGNAAKKAETVNVESRPVQLSVNAAAGIQYDLSGDIGIYAEPGLSYYFDDSSTLQTIYKERPLNFSLNVGLRFTFGN